MSEKLKKRIKSFLWLSGIWITIELLNVLSFALTDFRVPQEIMTVATFVIAQITKYLNNKLHEYDYSKHEFNRKKFE